MKATRRSLIERVLADYDVTEQEARAHIMGGRVFVNEAREHRPGFRVTPNDRVRLDIPTADINRAAAKLRGALRESAMRMRGASAVDLGAAHGGFTQVLLESGAAHVVAVDVAYGMFDYRLRNDGRVRLLERHNVREISRDWFLAEELDGTLRVVCDIAFLSLRTVLDAWQALLREPGPPLEGEGLFLLKPQFENSRATDRGVLRDEVVRTEIIAGLEQYAQSAGYELLGSYASAVAGASGNQEQFLHLSFRS